MVVKKSPGNRSYVKQILLLWAQIFFFARKQSMSWTDNRKINKLVIGIQDPRLAIEKRSNTILGRIKLNQHCLPDGHLCFC